MPKYNVKAPALPTAPPEYDPRRDDQLNYSLRLYFNRLDAFNSQMATLVNTQNVMAWGDAGRGFFSG